MLSDAFGHHVWATLRLLDTCSQLDATQLDAEVPGIYGSIISTLRHLVGADRSYLTVLSEGAVPDVDEDSLDLPEMQRVIERNGEVWRSVIAGDLDPELVVIRHRDDGSESHAPLGIRLAQVLHHGTDHRSQICTVLTTIGIEPPEIDVWDFAWQDERLKEFPPPA